MNSEDNGKETRQAKVSRRSFMENILLGAGAVSAGSIAGTAGVFLSDDSPPNASVVEAAAPANENHAGHGGSTAGGGASNAPAPAMTWQEMDAHHKEGMDAFFRNQETPITKGRGNEPLEPEIVDGVKVFRLTCDEIPDWEVSEGQFVSARGYNGAVPGPVLRGTEGETVRIIVTNNLTESTSIHWHGFLLPNNMDGVTFINQEPITPGETFTYEFKLRNPGTHMYHAHHNSMDQVNRGMLGAFIVDPSDPSTYPQYDREFIMVLNDLSLGYTINGKSFPATDALKVKLGERVVIRYLNEGVMNHPMHLHGMPQQIFAKDGWPMTPPQMCDTIDVAPGNRYDALVIADEPGTWAFHCHVLSHAEGPQGMFGLVTVMIVEE